MKNREQVNWCLKKKKGIEIVEPNTNICAAYLKKSENSLKSMNLNYRAKILDWAVEAAYYARYQTVYALLQKCGIKCEIHDCTLAAFKFLFENDFKKEIFEQIEQAKEQRINLTYYTNKLIPKEEIAKNISNTADFTIIIEEFINKLTSSNIKNYRERIRKFK